MSIFKASPIKNVQNVINYSKAKKALKSLFLLTMLARNYLYYSSSTIHVFLNTDKTGKCHMKNLAFHDLVLDVSLLQYFIP